MFVHKHQQCSQPNQHINDFSAISVCLNATRLLIRTRNLMSVVGPPSAVVDTIVFPGLPVQQRTHIRHALTVLDVLLVCAVDITLPGHNFLPGGNASVLPQVHQWAWSGDVLQAVWPCALKQHVIYDVIFQMQYPVFCMWTIAPWSQADMNVQVPRYAFLLHVYRSIRSYCNHFLVVLLDLYRSGINLVLLIILHGSRNSSPAYNFPAVSLIAFIALSQGLRT